MENYGHEALGTQSDGMNSQTHFSPPMSLLLQSVNLK